MHTHCFTSWPVWTGLKEGERKCLQAQEAAKKIIPIMLITFQTLTISFKILVMKISIFHLVSTVTQRHWLWQIHPIKPMLFSPFLCLSFCTCLILLSETTKSFAFCLYFGSFYFSVDWEDNEFMFTMEW